MIKTLLATIFVFCLTGVVWAKPIPNEVALEAITIFEQSPMSDDGEVAAATICQFAEESDDVYVEISMEFVSWLGEGENSPFHRQRVILLAAYLAGNLKAQMLSSKAADDPYSGLLQVLKTYSQLQQSDGDFTLPEVEKIKILYGNDLLRKYVDTNKSSGQ